MGAWLGLTVLLNVLSGILIVVVFALMKRQSGLRQDIQRIQKEWIQWRAMGMPSTAPHSAQPHSSASVASPESAGAYVSEHQIQEPAINFQQNVRVRGVYASDWGKSAGGIREKAAKSLTSETLGEPTDRFAKARELLRQGHGMKEVAVVTGLSYSELSLLSKTE